MSLLDVFSKGGKAVDTVSDIAKDISSGIDVLVETPEERAQYTSQIVDKWLTHFTELKDSQSIRAITRRILAVAWVGSFLVFAWIGLVTFLWNYYARAEVTNSAGQMIGPPAYCLQMMDRLEWGTLAVLVFYFGPFMLRYLKGAKLFGPGK